MRRLLTLGLVASVLLIGGVVRAQQDEVTMRRCCNHMCPVANNATKAGHEVVSKAPVFKVTAAELLA
jgi:hypothetical protein